MNTTTATAIDNHSHILTIINQFSISNNIDFTGDMPFSGLKGDLKPLNKGFEVTFDNHILCGERRNLLFGKQYNNINFKCNGKEFAIEDIFMTNMHIGKLSKFHTSEFRENQDYFFHLVIPLQKELFFLDSIDYTIIEDKNGTSSSGLSVTIGNDVIRIYTIVDLNKREYLVIGSDVKQDFEEFAEKAHSIKITLGYLLGHFPGDQGYFFMTNEHLSSVPDQYRFIKFRDTIISRNLPVSVSPWLYFGWDHVNKHYENLLRRITTLEFSNLFQKIHEIDELKSAIMLMLESHTASLLFKPGGYAIVLETLSDIIINSNKKSKRAPIKSKKTFRSIRDSIFNILNEHENEIDPDDMKVLKDRINQLNQTTNKARLRAPFELLGVTLNDADLKVLSSRNDFLHGRFPNFKDDKTSRSSDEINRDLFYASARFFTLINMILLKWIGFDGYTINYSKLNEQYTQIFLDEEPYRNVK